MDKFINKILREAEDSSDDFFQSKHINKRKDEFRKSDEGKIMLKMKSGISKVSSAYKNRIWESEKEKLFLKLFNRLHVSDEIYRYENIVSIFLDNKYGDAECCYLLEKNSVSFLIGKFPIWYSFVKVFNMSNESVESFLHEMIEKYFNIEEFIVSRHQLR